MLARSARRDAGTSTQTTEEPRGSQRRTSTLQGSKVGDKRMSPHMDFAAGDWWEKAILSLPGVEPLLLVYPCH